MKNIYLLLFAAFIFSGAPSVRSQTTGMDFNIIDCNGSPQHLFADLDAGNVVILEFFMTSCSPCVTAGQHLEAMKADLLSEFPGQIKSYAFGYNNTYTCSTVNSWVSTNGFSSIPSDSGATQVAYYGGMGMPTIVILGGGTNHTILGSPYIGFTTSDTITMANDIRNNFNPSGIQENNGKDLRFSFYPNPAGDEVRLSLQTEEGLFGLEIFDMTGRLVYNHAAEPVKTGTVRRSINTAGLAEGSYVIRVSAAGLSSMQKLNIVR